MKRTLIWSCLLAAVALFLATATLSGSYSQCNSQRSENYSQPQKPTFNEQAGTFLVCEGVTIDANGELITAIGTILIAGFTLTLWLVTGRAVDLAREEFVATHRPRMRVRFIKGPEAIDDDKWEFVGYIANVGDSPATIDSVVFEAFQEIEGVEVVIGFAPPVTDNLEIEIGAGLMIRRTAKDWGMFDAIWQSPVTIRGRVVYKDRNGNSRITSFARAKATSDSGWVKSEKYCEDEYED